jgi:prepilin-type N-terminal cleavage/methylation domain-containing protein
VKRYRKSGDKMRGYSIVELLVSMAIISIFSAFAVPSMVRTYRSYQMDDIASQVAAQLKFTRYEAIRRNNVMTCLDKTQNGYLTMFTDYNGDGTLQATEKRILFPANSLATLVTGATVPGSGNLAAVVGVGALTTMNPANDTLTFDGRGAKTTAGTSVYWVGNAVYGWRAVTVMPSGSVQVWSSATGAWKQLS